MKTAPTPAIKQCQACRKDVAGQRRMKDRHGRYWCIDCGQAEQCAERTSAVVNCPDCKKRVSVKDLIKRDAIYVCSACFKAGGGNGTGSKPRDEKQKRFALACGIVILGLGALLIVRHLDDLRSLF